MGETPPKMAQGMTRSDDGRPVVISLCSMCLRLGAEMSGCAGTSYRGPHLGLLTGIQPSTLSAPSCACLSASAVLGIAGHYAFNGIHQILRDLGALER